MKFCEKYRIPILSSILDDRRIAEAYSKGIMASEAFPEIRELFSVLYSDLRKKVEK